MAEIAQACVNASFSIVTRRMGGAFVRQDGLAFIATNPVKAGFTDATAKSHAIVNPLQ
jgi:hypothetical protein